MPQFSDDLYLGSALVANRGGANPTGNPSESSVGVGPVGRVYVFDVVPLVLQTNSIVAAATTAGAATLPLAFGTGTTSVVTPSGASVLKLDCARAITIQSAGAFTGVTFTVTGTDMYGQPVSVAMAGPGNNTVTTLKTFLTVSSVTVSATVGTAVNVGTADVIGLPWTLSNVGYIISRTWNNAADTSTITVADATTPATTATGDTRGKVALSSASDGTKRLVFVQALTGIQAGPNATRTGAIGVVPV